MSVEIAFGNNKLNVDNNGSARVLLYGTDGQPLSRANGAVSGDHGLQMSVVNDRVTRLLRGDRFGNVGLATHTPLFMAEFEGTTLNTQQWVLTQTTFAGAQTQGQYNQNPTNLLTANAVSALQTQMRFKKMQRQPLQAKFRARTNVVANAQRDIGFFLTTGTGQIANGAYFQIVAGGVFGVVTFNSVDVSVSLGSLAAVLPIDTAFYTFDVLLDDDEARFVVQSTANETVLGEATVRVPNLTQRMWQDTHLPFTSRLWNTGTPASASVSILTDLFVTGVDAASQRKHGQTLALSGLTNGANPQSGAQLATFANSAAPANATLSNTAAGYTTLGGLFAFAAVAGAATDYALFGFQVPATHNFVLTGLAIDAWNTGAAVATTPTLMEWFVQANSSAVSLATAATREHIGAMVFPVGAAIGAMADRSINRSFEHAPLVTFAGRFLIIGLRMPVATNTASQVIQGAVSVRGYFE
jgi:hypothetical protein